jgi:hypothetical protein
MSATLVLAVDTGFTESMPVTPFSSGNRNSLVGAAGTWFQFPWLQFARDLIFWSIPSTPTSQPQLCRCRHVIFSKTEHKVKCRNRVRNIVSTSKCRNGVRNIVSTSSWANARFRLRLDHNFRESKDIICKLPLPSKACIRGCQGTVRHCSSLRCGVHLWNCLSDFIRSFIVLFLELIKQLKASERWTLIGCKDPIREFRVCVFSSYSPPI